MDPFLIEDSFIKLGKYDEMQQEYKNIKSLDELKSLMMSKVDNTKTTIVFLGEDTVSGENPTFSNLCSDLPTNLH